MASEFEAMGQNRFKLHLLFFLQLPALFMIAQKLSMYLFLTENV